MDAMMAARHPTLCSCSDCAEALKQILEDATWPVLWQQVDRKRLCAIVERDGYSPLLFLEIADRIAQLQLGRGESAQVAGKRILHRLAAYSQGDCGRIAAQLIAKTIVLMRGWLSPSPGVWVRHLPAAAVRCWWGSGDVWRWSVALRDRPRSAVAGQRESEIASSGASLVAAIAQANRFLVAAGLAPWVELVCARMEARQPGLKVQVFGAPIVSGRHIHYTLKLTAPANQSIAEEVTELVRCNYSNITDIATISWREDDLMRGELYTNYCTLIEPESEYPCFVPDQ